MASLVQPISELLQARVRPLAAEIDRDPEALRAALSILCEHGLMALKRPLEFGGPEWGEEDFRTFQEEVARASGALAFLQTQHQSAVGLLSRSPNEAMKREWLPKMADGEALVGIGFSQLRRPGPPLVRATQHGDNIRFDGHVPWITGYGFFSHFLLAGELPDGRSAFALVPFAESPAMRISPPMRLSGMEAAQTVTADLDGLVVSSAEVMDFKPPKWIFRNDLINITLQGYFAIGCALAGIDVVREQGTKKSSDTVLVAAQLLLDEVTACRDAMRKAMASGNELTTHEKLQLRARAITLATRCAHAAVVASGGSANLVDHPANRVLRESLVFSVSGQTTEIRDETLARLANGTFGT